MKLSLKSGKTWLQQSCCLIHNYRGGPGGNKRLRTLNKGVGLEVWTSPKIIFLEKEILINIEKQSLYDGQNLALFQASALNAGDRTEETGKKNEMF